MKMPLVSIIIPCYNSQLYILKTLKSIIDQTYKKIEIIIVDDGSVDNTVDVARKFLDNKKYGYKILKQSNSGVSKARNYGLDNCKGDYIFFLDSDDYINKHCIEKMVNKFLEKNLDIVWCGYDYVDENGIQIMNYEDNYKYISSIKNGEYTLIKQLNHTISICNINIMYSRSVIMSNCIRFKEGCKYGEDQEFIIKSLFYSKNIGCVEEVLTFYLQRSNSASHIFKQNRFTGLGAAKRVSQFIYNNSNNKNLKVLSNNKIALEIIQIYHNYLICNKDHYKDDKYKFIFNNLRKKYRNNLIRFKVTSKNDIKYKIIITLFYIDPNMYAKLLKIRSFIRMQ